MWCYCCFYLHWIIIRFGEKLFLYDLKKKIVS